MITLDIAENGDISCELGLVETPIPKEGYLESPSHLILVGTNFANAAARRPQMWNGTLTTVDRTDDQLRMVVMADNGCWVYLLHECTWRDLPHADSQCYVGVWPD